MAATHFAIKRAPVMPGVAHTERPVILTARPLLVAHPMLAARLLAADCELLLARTWDRLLVGVEKAVVDVVLIDLDAVDCRGAGHTRISGRRLVSLLARRLTELAPMRENANPRLALLTRLDYVEIEDIMRLGVHILARPDDDPTTLLKRLLAMSTVQLRSVGQRQRESAEYKTDRKRASMEVLAQAPFERQERQRLPESVWRTIATTITVATSTPLATAPLRAKASSRAPRVSDRAVMEGLCHMLRMGGGWANYPRVAGAPSTARRRLQRWRTAGVFTRLGALALAGDMGLRELLALPWASIGVVPGAGAQQPAYEATRICKQ